MTARPSMRLIWMRLAVALAERSTCSRLQVGAVITNHELTQVLGVGYNGGAKGLPNGCDHPDRPGQCGCLHAEINALLKANHTQGGAAFVSTLPCVMCAKALINAGIGEVHFHHRYRDNGALSVFREAGVVWYHWNVDLISGESK